MQSVLLIFSLLALLSIIIAPMINLYSAINTTLELISVNNKIKLKELKKTNKDVL